MLDVCWHRLWVSWLHFFEFTKSSCVSVPEFFDSEFLQIEIP